MFEEKSIFDSFNARHLTAEQIAETFVPPLDTFSELTSVSNHLVTGPRGSGKTTLLRMLTIPALLNWHHVEAAQFLNRIGFIGVFIPADRNWHGQLKTLSQYDLDASVVKTLGESAFTSHILKALITTFQDLNLATFGPQTFQFIATLLNWTLMMSRIVRQIATAWRLEPAIPTFLGLQTALSSRLIDIGMLRRAVDKRHDVNLKQGRYEYLLLDHRECVRFAIELHNNVSNRPSRRFCLMFDELEIAPSTIQQALLADLRGGADQNICVFKLALAPFNKHFYREFNEIQPTPKNDFVHIDLTYARKEYGYDFSGQLVKSMLQHNNLPQDDARSLLGESGFNSWDADASPSPYDASGNVTFPYINLLLKISVARETR